MPRPKRNHAALASETLTPPPTLPSTHTIARVVTAAGNNLYKVSLPHAVLVTESRKLEIAAGTTTLVEMAARFRNVVFVKRGSFVVVDANGMFTGERVGGEVVNVVRGEKTWRAMSYWPKEFELEDVRMVAEGDSEEDEEEESNMGKMPPSDSDSET